jgi:LysR family transcriptional regulator, glycine cleavage system transcriptional activator
MAMNIPRRLLPSLPALSAFEAAARTGSVTAAAQELNLTQSAVSRQIKLLEQQLEIVLFRRERQTIRLTAAGHAYVCEVREGLRRIGAASLKLRANPAGGTLSLAVLPTFGTKWLVPRLPGFIDANPGVVINLFTRLSRFDFREEAIDAAVHFGENNWSSAESVLLRPEIVVPACSPDYKNKYAFVHPSDLREVPLLHLTTRPDAWEQWLSQHSAIGSPVRGMLFDQLTTSAAAAAAGLGVALLPIFLFEEELTSGRLVRALDLPMQMAAQYYLVWPGDRSTYPPLVAFRQWLVGATAGESP